MKNKEYYEDRLRDLRALKNEDPKQLENTLMGIEYYKRQLERLD